MNELALFKEVIAQIKSGLTAAGLTSVAVKQSNQPTQQGANVGPTVYIQKIMNKRYGYVGVSDVYDTVNSEMVHTESQYYETTFQIMVWATQDPSAPNAPTAQDISNIVAASLQSDAAIGFFSSKGIGVLRVTDIRPAPFQDDRDRWEFAPSFDFTATHKQDTVSTIGVVETLEYNINRV